MAVRLRKPNYQAFDTLLQWQKTNPAQAKKMALRLSAAHPKLGGDCLSLPCRFLLNEEVFRDEVGRLAVQRDLIALEIMGAIRTFPKKDWKTVQHPPQIRGLNIEISSGGINRRVERLALLRDELMLGDKSILVTAAYVIVFNKKDSSKVFDDSFICNQSHPRKLKAQRLRMHKLLRRVTQSFLPEIVSLERIFVVIVEQATKMWGEMPFFIAPGTKRDVSLINNLDKASVEDIRKMLEALLYEEGKIIASVRDGGKKFKR